MARILIIDDETAMCRLLSSLLAQNGYETEAAFSLEEGQQLAEQFSPDVVLLDMILPDGNGLDAIQPIRSVPSVPEVIVLTGYADVDAAELATRRGAWSYIVKSFTTESMLDSVKSALHYRNQKRPTISREVLKTEGIVGTSVAIRKCMELLGKASLTDASILITGETGTGKELFARAIHSNSRRRHRNFVVVDCAALPETLVESVLFGHTKGAFTGAESSRDGLIMQADGGTLFLDEVGELPLTLQKPLLRVLQEHRFRPVGSDKEVESDFRLVAATNRDLTAMVKSGHFREDLLYRLKTFTLSLPPLRSHSEDIQELVAYHMGRACVRSGAPPKTIAPEFFEALTKYEWPGNVRELVQAIDRALLAAQDSETLFPKHLPEEIRVHLARSTTSERAADAPQVSLPPMKPMPSLKEVRETAADAAERRYLIDLLALTKNDVAEACAISELSKSRFYTLLRKHGISTRE